MVATTVMPLVEGATGGTGSLMGMAIPLNTASLGSRPTCVSETTFSCCFCIPIDLLRGHLSPIILIIILWLIIFLPIVNKVMWCMDNYHRTARAVKLLI